MLLIEHEHVQMSARGALVRRDLARHGAARDVCVRVGRLFDVLKEHDRPPFATFDDFDLFLREVTYRPSLFVEDADVQADELDAGSECRLRALGESQQDQHRFHAM